MSRKEPHPMDVLRVIAQYEPVHYSMFHDVEELSNIRITKTALRVLRRHGWIHPEIEHVWLLTTAGKYKAADAAGGE